MCQRVESVVVQTGNFSNHFMADLNRITALTD